MSYCRHWENWGCGGSSCTVTKMWKLVEKHFPPVTCIVIGSSSHVNARLFIFTSKLFIKIFHLPPKKMYLKTSSYSKISSKIQVSTVTDW